MASANPLPNHWRTVRIGLRLRGMGRTIQSLIVFVLLLVVLNFFLGELDYGVHISIVGSIVLTLVVSFVMNALSGSRGG